MIKPEHIPDEAVEKALEIYGDYKSMRSSIAAAINAWPDMWHVKTPYYDQRLILPLPQEKNDD